MATLTPLTGGDGTSGQTGLQVRTIIDANLNAINNELAAIESDVTTLEAAAVHFSDNDFEGAGTSGDPITINPTAFDVIDRTNPLVAVQLVDDFISSGAETGEIGSLGWQFVNGSIAVHTNEQNHPGSFTRTSGASTDQINVMFLGNASTSTSTSFRFDEFDEMTWIIKLAATSTDFRVRCGVVSFGNDENSTHGVFFERLQADTEWFGTTRNATTGSRTAALATLSTNWIKLKLRRINATTVGFSVDGGAEVTKTGDIPDAADNLMPYLLIVPSTANARSLAIDFFSMKLLPVTR